MWEQESEITQAQSAQADTDFVLPHFEGFEAIEALSASSREAGWDAEYRQLSSGELFATSKYQVIDTTSIIVESANQRLQVEGVSPAGCVTILTPLPDTRLRINGDDFAENDFILLKPGADLSSITRRDACVLNLHIPLDNFERYLEVLPPHGYDFFEDAQLVCKNVALIGELRRNLIHSMYRRRDIEFDAPFESEVITQLIRFMTSRDRTERRTERLARSTRQRALIRAVEFVEEHYSQTLKMTELCNYANVSLSTLERIFTREMQVTPVNYLKLRRLHAVRTEIANAQDTRSIAEIATRNGFAHLGRFSAAYKNQFGVLPKIDRRKSASIL